MMVRIEYEGGRTTLFDTLSFTEGSPFTGANMLTEFELEMRDEPEKGLWLTANWHQVRDDWRADAPADGIPAARRSRGWRFMLASEAELGRARDRAGLEQGLELPAVGPAAVVLGVGLHGAAQGAVLALGHGL